MAPIQPRGYHSWEFWLCGTHKHFPSNLTDRSTGSGILPHRYCNICAALVWARSEENRAHWSIERALLIHWSGTRPSFLVSQRDWTSMRFKGWAISEHGMRRIDKQQLQHKLRPWCEHGCPQHIHTDTATEAFIRIGRKTELTDPTIIWSTEDNSSISLTHTSPFFLVSCALFFLHHGEQRWV